MQTFICGSGNEITVNFNNLEVDRRTADCEQQVRIINSF